MNADDVSSAHVWPTGDTPDSDGRIWVTPKIPFIVPITAAALFVTFIGNIMFLI
jgi:prepilin signal peptidase PulO-like enzyme (type II secretory pathway)